MDFRKTKNFLHRTCVTGLIALMLTSCITNRPIEVAEPAPPAEPAAAPVEMPKTTNDVQPNITAADEATWAEIEERQRQQELIRQALEEAARLEAERIEQERLEAERLEAERIEAERLAEEQRLEQERLEAERLEAERLEAERLEAERLAEEQRLAELEALEAQEEENPLAYILDEVEPEPEVGWIVKTEDPSAYIPSETPVVEIQERTTESDRILSGENGNNMPSWLMSPKEQEEVALGSSLQVVNIYQPLEQEKEESNVTADDILAFGSVYTADREAKVPVKDMDREQRVAKIIEIGKKGVPYAIIALALIISFLLLKFLKNKIINPTRKRKIKEQEGVEVIADGFMVARPGQGTDPGPLEMQDEEEQEPTQNQDKAAVSEPEPEPEPAREDKPEADPRVNKDEDYEDKSPMFNIKAPWKPVNRADENKGNQSDGNYKEVSDEDLTFLVPD